MIDADSVADRSLLAPQQRLILGDCLEVIPTLPAKSVHMVFADLPYGRKLVRLAWNNCINLQQLWGALSPSCATNARYIFTGTQPFTTALINGNPDLFRYSLVWSKHGAANFARAKFEPLRVHEDVLVFYRKNVTYNPQMLPRDKPRFRKAENQRPGLEAWRKEWAKVYTHKYPGSIISADRQRCKGSGIHPTQKPVALLEWLIRTYTNEGDTVLDPTAGSFTTAIAAMRTGRKSICIEKDVGYFNAGVRRVVAERERIRRERHHAV